MKISKILGALLMVGAMGLVAAPAFAAEPKTLTAGSCAELQTQIYAAYEGDTVLLTSDMECTRSVGVGVNITLDLANYDITFKDENISDADPEYGLMVKQGGEIVGSGKIVNTVNDGIALIAFSGDGFSYHLTIGEDVTLEGNTALQTRHAGAQYMSNEDGIEIDVYGTLRSTGDFGIFIPADDWADNVINIKNTAKIIAPMEEPEAKNHTAIAVAGYADLELGDDAEVSGYYGITARAGYFQFYGGKMTTTKEAIVFLSDSEEHPGYINLFINDGEFRSRDSVIFLDEILQGDSSKLGYFTIYGGDFYSGEEGKIFEFSDYVTNQITNGTRDLNIFGGDYNFPLPEDFLSHEERQAMFPWNGMYKVVGVLENIEGSMPEGIKAGMEVGQQMDYNWGITKFKIKGYEVSEELLAEFMLEGVPEKTIEELRNSDIFALYNMRLLLGNEERVSVDDMETFIFIPASEIKGEYDNYRMRYVEYTYDEDDKLELNLTDETHDCTEMEDGSYVCPLYHFSVYGLEGYNDEVFVPAAPDTSAAGEITFVAVMLTIVSAIFATVGVGVAVNKRG